MPGSRKPLRPNPSERCLPRARGPFGPLDRPRIEACHQDGQWYPGRLHGWLRRDGAWSAVVTYATSPGIQFYTCVPAAEVRPLVDVDHQRDDQQCETS
jgi:hypothetical protein